jgi:dihydrofolate reductase
MTISIIVATNKRGYIGNNGHLMWHIPEDLAHFSKLTSGHDIVMGRKTWESLPIRPLPNRTNYVLTRDTNYNQPGAINFHSIDDVPTKDLIVKGGEEIYRLYIQKADAVYMTIVDDWSYGDRFFPFERDFSVVSKSEKKRSASGLEYRFLVMK